MPLVYNLWYVAKEVVLRESILKSRLLIGNNDRWCWEIKIVPPELRKVINELLVVLSAFCGQKGIANIKGSILARAAGDVRQRHIVSVCAVCGINEKDVWMKAKHLF